MHKVTIGNATLYNADCLDVMRGMGEGSVDAVITDPPYGIGADKGTDGFGVSSGRRYSQTWDNEPPRKEYFDLIINYKRVFIFGGNYFTDKLPMSSHWLVWDKVGEIKFNNPFSHCELIWTNCDKRTVKKYTVIQQGFISEEKDRYHPTQKPIKLVKNIIEDYIGQGDTILDPFMGSGTTGVACLQTDRKFIGVELDPDYFEIACKRIRDAAAQPTLWSTTCTK